MQSTSTRIVAGFLAGAVAVLIFHQGMYFLMQQYGGPYGIKLGGAPLRTNPVPLWPELFKLLQTSPIQVPTIARQMIWGGMFGSLLGLLYDRMWGGISLIKALVFAFVFPTLLVGWMIIPLMRGEAMFSGAFAKGGFNIMALRNGFLLNTVGFGIGLGLLFPFVARLMRRRSA